MKSIFQKNENKIFILLCALSLCFSFACKNESRINPPQFQGKFRVDKAYESFSGKEENIPNNLSVVFHDDKALIFGEEFKDISFATKRVNLVNYFIYNNVSYEKIFNISDVMDYAFVISVLNEGRSLGEIVEYNNKQFLYYQNHIYELQFIKQLDDQEYDIARKKTSKYKAKPIYKPLKTTAAFIGLRDDSKECGKYFTLFLYSDYNSTNVFLTDGLVIPKSNGYININDKKVLDGGIYTDYLVFRFNNKYITNPIEHLNIEKYFLRQTSIIDYVSPYMISLNTNYKSFLNNVFKERYETYSLEKNGLRTKLDITDILGNNWMNLIKGSLDINSLKKDDYTIIPSNVGIVRRNGYWILRTHLYSDIASETVYARIDPNYLQEEEGRSFLSMEDIKYLYPSAVDYSASPEKTLAIVNTGSNLKVVSLSSNDLDIRDEFSLINNKYKLVMDNWLVGAEAEAHLFNINKLDDWIKIY